MRSVLLILILSAIAVFAGNDSKQGGVTEPCWRNADGSYSFSKELVKTLAKSDSFRRDFCHSPGKVTRIYYDKETEVYRVVPNFVAIPHVVDSSETNAKSDAKSGQAVEYEMRWNPVTKELEKVPKQ